MMDLDALRGRRDLLDRIDWELTPQEAVEMFDHRTRGLERRLQVRGSGEKHYFFCVDNWRERPELILKERSIKEARVIARIDAPSELLQACVRERGDRKGLFPLSPALQEWLRKRLAQSPSPGH